MIFDEMLGRTMVRVENDHNERLVFEDTEGTTYEFLHVQDCCESVTIEDVCGDLKDLVGSPILQAEEVDNEDAYTQDECGDVQQWTFYKFATNKGYVHVRWYGTSNGYYSTSVFFRIQK